MSPEHDSGGNMNRPVARAHESNEEHALPPYDLTLPDDLSGLEEFVNEQALDMIDRAGVELGPKIYNDAVNAVISDTRIKIIELRAIKNLVGGK